MSKIGRKPINIGEIDVQIKGQDVSYKGSKGAGMYRLPDELRAEVRDNSLVLEPSLTVKKNRELNQVWGLHRALLANKINGARKPFTTEVQIHGLGFKAVPSGKNLIMSLGYSHKIDFAIPTEVTVSVDKVGQKLIFESSDKTVLGAVVSKLRSLRPPEVYKGTGIRKSTEAIIRKVGKKRA